MENTLAEILSNLDKTKLIIPEELTKNIMQTTGCHSSEPACAKLISLAVQMFITDTLNEVLDVVPQRPVTSLGVTSKDQRLLLNMRDLAGALEAMGVKIEKPTFFSDQPLSN